jgi:RNA polymerase sigma-70 factor (ECF subfamily)
MAGSTIVPSSDPAGRDPAGASQASERNEFAGLYQQWYPVVREVARSLLQSDIEADGAAQRIFLRLFKAGTSAWKWRDPEQFFRRAGRNEARSAQRRKSRFQGLTDELLTALRSADSDPEDTAARTEFSEALRRSVAKLPPRCGHIVSLFLFEGLTQAEIARRLGITASAVERQLARGRSRLRQQLDQFRD